MARTTTGVGRSVWGVQFYKENDGIAFGSGANIDDLFAADCTLECYVRVANNATIARFLTKAPGTLASGWAFYTAAGTLTVSVAFAVTPIALSGANIQDDKWHHIALDWDQGTLTARAFIDGTVSATGIAAGAYQVDAAEACLVNAIKDIGTGDDYMSIGPIRISNSRRYVGASFDPPRRINWPANDANAQLITRMNDGAGVTVTDYSGNGYNGTITFGANTRWYNDPVE